MTGCGARWGELSERAVRTSGEFAGSLSDSGGGGGEEAPEEEGGGKGEGQDGVFKTDVAADEFHAPGDVGIALAGDEGTEGFGACIGRLDFDGDQMPGCAQEKVLFQGRIFAFVVHEVRAGLVERLADDVFAKSAFPPAQVPVGTQVGLGFVVEHRDEQAGVGHVELEAGLVVVGPDGQFGHVQGVAGHDDPGVAQPFDAAAVIPEAGVAGDLGNLEFLVFAGELDGHVVEDVQDAGLVEALGVFAYIVAVGRHDLPLEVEGSLEGLPFEVGADHLRHAPEDAEVQEEPVEQGQIGGGEGTPFGHVGEEFPDVALPVPFCGQEFGKVQRAQGVVRLGADGHG